MRRECEWHVICHIQSRVEREQMRHRLREQPHVSWLQHAQLRPKTDVRHVRSQARLAARLRCHSVIAAVEQSESEGRHADD